MKFTSILLGYFILLLSNRVLAQKIDNTASFRNINSISYCRLNYENDWFREYDQYYTQGIFLEYVNQALVKNPISRLLLKLPIGSVKYGLAFEHNAYTPTSIRSNQILTNDRPFAACVTLKSFSISTDTISRSRLSAGFSIGVIGQAARAKEMQSTIHYWVGDKQPLGWQYQIQNDIVLNYELSHEKLLLNTNFFSLNTNLQAKVGSINNKAQLGFTTTLGKFNSPLAFGQKSKGFQLYIYNQPLINFIAFDATMQGGLLNKKSPYTLHADEIERIVLQNNFGAVLVFKKLYLEYNQTIIGKEFSKGEIHRWGGVKIGMILNYI